MKKYTRKQITALGPCKLDETPVATTKRLVREAVRKLREAQRLVESGLVKYSDALERTGADADCALSDYRRSLDLAHEAHAFHLRMPVTVKRRGSRGDNDAGELDS